MENLVSGTIDIIYNYYRKYITNDQQQFVAAEIENTLISEIKKESDIIINQVSERVGQVVKDNYKNAGTLNNKNQHDKVYNEHTLFGKIHDFIMKNYIKEAYQEGEILKKDIEIYSDLFKLSIDVIKDSKNVKVEKNIFDFIREDVINRRV